ncbi:MAG TPA: SDR family oxidoreductase [Gemmatimonadaceae bacterium]|nr:SDR family oxidoreductase [Gemmatimonadaceae bacterium]
MTALPASALAPARRGERRPIAIITGASSGIGRELAELFARDHYDLILVARRREALEQLARTLIERHGVSCDSFAADLTRRLERERLAARIRTVDAHVEALVNNAGIGTHGYFHETDLERELEIIELNIAAVTHLTKVVLPGMLGRRRGRILNVSSVAAFQPGPLMAVYYASKAFVQSFSEALAEEVDGTGVTVTAVCPGPTITEFHSAAGIAATAPTVGAPTMSSREVAEVAYREAARGKRVVVTGLRNKVVVLANRLLSRRRMTRIVRRLQERRRDGGR